MYENYWQLEQNPFENDVDPQFYYRSETHQAALLKLRYLVENRKGIGVLTGASGVGKSFLTQVLAQQISGTIGPFIPIRFPNFSPAELMAYLAVELGADPNKIGSETGGLDKTVRELENLLRQLADHGQHAVVLVDEAHLIDDPQVFQALRLLLNFPQQQKSNLTLILAGQQELLCKVRRVEPLDERVAVKCILRPLDLEETLSYVSTRLQAAGAKRPLFEPDAVTAVFELSGGIPRRINRICDVALLVGYADDTPRVTVDQVEAVFEELTTAVVD